MIWVTWRQHRLEGLWAFSVAALLAAAIVFITNELISAACAQPGNGYCFPSDAAGQLAQRLVQVNLVTYGLVVLPALAGAFVGAPLVAREIENGTAWLAWTQGVTRLHWFLVKLGLVFAPLLLGAALVGILYVLLINANGPQANHWDFFDQQAPLTVAATAFALALGVAAGSVVGKSIPAMAVTLFGFVVTRVGIAELARPNFMSPLAFTTQDPSVAGNFSGPNWWLDQPEYHDASGHILKNGLSGISSQASNADVISYMREHGLLIVQHYQPASRFWTVQTIESAILVGLAMVLLGVSAYWVTRR